MSQTIKLKRSAIAGKVPTTSSLDLGEVAINTNDGKVFFKKDDGIQSIQTIVTTDSLTTGSVNLSGSLTASSARIADLNYPTSDGTSGQAIGTDGLGNLTFFTPGTGTGFPFSGSADLTGSLNITGSLNLNDYTFPTTDGEVGYAIITDGSGNLIFAEVGSGTGFPYTGSAELTGSLEVTGNSFVTGAFFVTGALNHNDYTFPETDGQNGYAIITDGNGNLVFAQVGSGTGFPFTGSAELTGSLIVTGNNITTGSLAVSGSLVTVGDVSIDGTIVATGTTLVSGSSQIDHDATTNFVANEHIDHSTLVLTAGEGLNGGGILTSSLSISVDGSVARTGSNSFVGDQSIDGNLTITGAITAEQYIVSSSVTFLTQSFSSGSTIFGDSLDDTHEFTGSVSITGSLNTNGNAVIDGTIVATGTTLISSSAQVDHDTTTNFVANEHIDHSTVSITAGAGIEGGGNITTTRTIALNTGSTHFTDGVKTKLNTDNVISSSIQVDHDGTTNFVANEHIDHSTVSITAGLGISGGGDITSTRTVTLDTGSLHFTDGVKTKLNTENVISSSVQVDHDATTNFVVNEHIDHSGVTLTAGDGLSGGGDITTSRSFAVDATVARTGSNVFTGDQYVQGDITASVVSASYIDLNITPDGGAPAWKEGRIFYDSEDGALSVYNSEADITLQVGQEFWKKVKNGSGAPILNGTPVRISGSVGGNPLAYPATAEDHTSGGGIEFENHIIGIATHDISTNGVGFVTEKGLVRNLNTLAFDAGDTLYLQTGSPATPADYFRNDPPPFPYDVIQAGVVTNSHATEGTIEVAPMEPVHFGIISGLSGSASTSGELWIYEDGTKNAWAPGRTLSGSYDINGGSLNVDGNVTASFFTGSFVGDGTQVTGVTAASVAFNDITGKPTLVSSSVQIDHDATTNFVANEHIDHSGVTLTAGDGLTGGGDITTNRSFAVDSTVVRTSGDQTIAGIKTFTGNNVFSGNQTFTDITVDGTGSFAYIQSVTGSAKIIGDAYVIVNNNTPSERYAGLKVFDSGSAGVTASLEFDGESNDWFYEYSDDGGVTTDHGVVIFGPEYSTKGSPTYLGNNKVQKGTGGHHLADTNITDDGVNVSIGIDLIVTGSATVTSLIETSTRDLKDNIIELVSQNETIKELQPVTYTWKETGEEDFGLIAEDVAEIAPHLVQRDLKGKPTGIKYSKLSVLLLDVVQRQSTLIEDLNKRITKLENERG